MKFLVAIALLAFVVAEASRLPGLTLPRPHFKEGLTYRYEAQFNVTAGVLGLSSQVSASVLYADVKIRVLSGNEHVLKLENVRSSKSVAAVDGAYGDMQLHPEPELEERLSTPIRFTFFNGTVTKYSLSPKDNLETRKLKRSVLRSLEMEIPEDVTVEDYSQVYVNTPVMYNTTKNSRYGVHVSNYVITSSPDVEYPLDKRVFNISRTDNCEGEWYPGYKLHHNFQSQGCPEVCRSCKEWRDNYYGAGCPSGFEPHHSPIKRSFTHDHYLSMYDEVLTPETITTVETHFAKMYDQDMEVLIRYRLRRVEVTTEELTVEEEQQMYEDLHNYEAEIDDEELDKHCEYERPEKLVETALRLLDETAALLVKNETHSPVGEKVVLLRDVFSKFTFRNFRELVRSPGTTFPFNHEILHTTDEVRIKRQVWLQMLPLVGTPDSVKFMVEYLQRALSRDANREMTVREATEMLESLPQNIERPDRETLMELKKLMNDRFTSKSALLHSAVYMTVGRMIGQACGYAPLLRVEEEEKRTWLKSFQRATPEHIGLPECPREAVREVVEDMRAKLTRTTEAAKMAVYVEALTYCGVREVLDVVSPYAHGTAENLREFSPRHASFMRTVVLKSLHNIVRMHPANVLEIVLPIYFNETETPKVRNTAFGVLVRCQPSRAVLERIVSHSWFEKSREVGSFVTSTLETFGNSSTPCMQLLSSRIQEVLPQMKKFNIGLHHAKNHMWTYFDDLRQFGLEGRFEYTPNNESIVPSTFYHSLSYTMDSLRDVVYQNSLNMEGLTHAMILNKLRDYIALKPVATIPEDTFGLDNDYKSYVEPHTVDELRFVTSQKFFYKTSFYYLDRQSRESAMVDLREFFKTYLWLNERDVYGYWVKVFLPSSYHTVAMGKTLPYPVEFQMRQPVVFSLSVKSDETVTKLPTLKKFHLHLRPSFYLTKVFTHQMKNLRDCKEVGVYHMHKIGMNYPFELQYDAEKLRDTLLEFKYKIPKIQGKNVLYYYTDAGTYVGKKSLDDLPLNDDRRQILTRPAPFKFETEVDLVGMPPLHVAVHSEDINLFRHKVPRSFVEALHMAVTRVLNSGWRYKSANVTVSEDSPQWANGMEAVFRIEYNRTHVEARHAEEEPHSAWNRNSRSPIWEQDSVDYDYSQRMQRRSDDDDYSQRMQRRSDDDDYSQRMQRRSDDDDYSQRMHRQFDDDDDDDWRERRYFSAKLRALEDDDWLPYILPKESYNLKDMSKNGKIVAAMLENSTHMLHTLKVSLSATNLASETYLYVNYNHTYDKKLHCLHAKVYSNEADDKERFELSLNHVMGFKNQPDELEYSTKYGRQDAYFITTLDWPNSAKELCPWENEETGATGTFQHKSLREVLQDELAYDVDEEYFLPETYKECLTHVENGNPLSVDCVKAIREHSAYNYLNMFVAWNSRFPENKKAMRLAKQLDTFVKHYMFEHLTVSPEGTRRKNIAMNMTYIDKFVDEPVLDWHIMKDYETVSIKRYPLKTLQPVSSIYPLHEAFLLKKTNNTYPARCVMSTMGEQNLVQTYDLVEYRFTPRDCFYVLSAHCTENKLFAVLLKNSQELHVYLAKMKFVLRPQDSSSSGFTVLTDKEEVTVKDVHVFHRGENIYAYVENYELGKHQHLRLVGGNAGVSVLYDGKTVKIQVSPTYKGELCGLCSEFDGQDIREFRGVDRCLYRDPERFAESNIVKREGECYPRNVNGEADQDERICDMLTSKPRSRTPPHTPPRGRTEQRIMRNKVQYRGDEVCFTVRAIPTCPEGRFPTQKQKMEVGFHCLPVEDETCKKLVAEAPWRTLNELRRKSVDHVQEVEVAIRC